MASRGTVTYKIKLMEIITRLFYVVSADNLEQECQNAALKLETTLVETISNNIENILQKTHVIALIELISDVLISIHILQNKMKSFQTRIKD